MILHPRIDPAMRIRRLLPLFSALLALSACDGGTLTGPEPIHGRWAAETRVSLPNLDIDRAEHRYEFRPDGNYASTMIGLQQVGTVWRVVYVGETTGEYRLEPGGVAVNTVTRRWRTAEMLTWQDERVVDDDVFSLPMPYTVDGNRLIMHYGPTTGEHGEPIPAEDRVYTRR